MEQIEIGLWVTAGLLVLVVSGMRVAFAAALAGVVGLVLIFWAKKDFDPDKFGWALTVAVNHPTCRYAVCEVSTFTEKCRRPSA